MYVFTDSAVRTISDMLASHRAVKSRSSLDTSHSRAASEDGDGGVVMVLPSSTELFYFYGQTLEACAILSTGKPLYDLFEVFKKWLKIYAGTSPTFFILMIQYLSVICRGGAYNNIEKVGKLMMYCST